MSSVGFYFNRLHCALDCLVLHPQCPNNVIGDHVPFPSIGLPERAFKNSHSLLLLPPLRSSLLCRLVVALMPPPLTLSTLPPPLNVQPWPIEAPSPLVRWSLSFRLPLVRRLVVASPFVACLGLASPFVAQAPQPLCLRQLVVTSHLFAPLPPLNVQPSHD
jgi:hypothetical protein